MKIKLIVFYIMLMQVAKSQNVSISGYVEDLKTGERIIGAYVIDSISKKGTSTNDFGFYHIGDVHGKVALKASYLGYKSQVKYIMLTRDSVINFTIDPVREIQEVVIEGSQYNRDENTPLGMAMIPVQLLTSMPELGEPDLLKSIQNQPGIKGGVEGSAGIFVRGGGPGENLYMIDDVPIYSVSHLYGFFSAFNVSAVKDVELLKGDFPARYGGRTSSVIDVRSLDGNNKSIQGEVSLGLISSRFTLQGPLFNDKTTFMVSARRSYFDVITPALKKTGVVGSAFPDYYFYDINACLAHTFSRIDRVYLSFYNGKDHIITNTEDIEFSSNTASLTEKSQEISGWGNLIGSLRWNHIFGNSLFVNTTLAYSGYNYFIQNQFNSLDIDVTDKTSIARNYLDNYTSGITDVIAKTDFEYSATNNQRFRFGAGITFHTFNPGKDNYTMNDQLLNEKLDTIYANALVHADESYLYAEDEIKIAQIIRMNAGIRLSEFNSQTSHYINPEPRLSANFRVLPALVLKAGYSRMVQYMHLLNTYNVSWPSDLWIPATNGIKPLTSDQVNMGLSYNWKKKILISLEVYQKWLNNTTDYQNGASLTTEFVPWYDKVTQGTGYAKGLELSVEKQVGRLTGRINYTLSSSVRTYGDLNNGVTFPFAWDRRHDFNIFANYKISKKWDASALWVYGTGYPATIATTIYTPNVFISNNSPYNISQIDYYPSLNNLRLPPYHRLDLGVHRKTQVRLGEITWSFDVFNAYNRKNPDDMYYTQGYVTTAQGIYLINYLTYGSLLPLIPSVTFTFKWK